MSTVSAYGKSIHYLFNLLSHDYFGPILHSKDKPAQYCIALFSVENVREFHGSVICEMVRSLVNTQKRSIFTKISTHGPRKPTIQLLSEAVPEMAWTIQVTAITRNWKYKCQSLYNNNYDYIMYFWLFCYTLLLTLQVW